MKEAKIKKAEGELAIMRKKVKELGNFFTLINTYDCIDWDPSIWSDKEENNLMHYVAMEGTVEMAKVLLSQPRMDSECLPRQNANGRPPLVCANDKDIIELFEANLHEYEHINDQ